MFARSYGFPEGLELSFILLHKHGFESTARLPQACLCWLEGLTAFCFVEKCFLALEILDGICCSCNSSLQRVDILFISFSLNVNVVVVPLNNSDACYSLYPMEMACL